MATIIILRKYESKLNDITHVTFAGSLKKTERQKKEENRQINPHSLSSG